MTRYGSRSGETPKSFTSKIKAGHSKTHTGQVGVSYLDRRGPLKDRVIAWFDTTTEAETFFHQVSDGKHGKVYRVGY